MMADRVHPRDTDSPPTSGEHSKNNNTTPYNHRHTMSQDSLMSKDSYAPYHSGPPSGTYVVQVPKDQIYRIPPPENARKFEIYQRRKNRGSRCRCCCCTILGIILLLVALVAIAGLLFYFIVKPKTPDYSVEKVSIEGFNLTSSTSSSATISPEFKVTVRSENRNGKLGIHYESGGSVTVYHDDVKLCDGDLPAFYQRPKNVTVFATNLKGSGIVLSSDEKGNLLSEEKQGKVGFKLDVIVPVKIKLGIIKTWRITAKIKCNVIVNGLTVDAKVVSKDCDVDVKPW